MKVAIASGKGGTGKTTLSTNLAAFLAPGEPVILADLDVEEPDSGLFLAGELVHEQPMHKWSPVWERGTCSGCGRCQAICRFNAVLKLKDDIMVFPELCHACFACSELCPTGSLPMRPREMGRLRHFRCGPLDFVESRLRIGEEQAAPLIKQTLGYLAQQGPASALRILDSPPGTSCPVIEVVRGADLVLLVAEPTPFGLHDLKLAVETVRRLGKPCAVVLNRDGLGDNGVVDLCREAGIPLAARIPHSRRIAEAYARGKLLFEEIPEVAAALRQVSRFIAASREALVP